MKLYVAGIRGMVGSAIAQAAQTRGYNVIGRSSKELDLTNRTEVLDEIVKEKPDSLVIAAARVGGIGANMADPVGFLSVNLQIQTNLLDAAHQAGTKRVLFMGSSCIYPRNALQPMTEEMLLTGELEPTNLSYSLAKISGLKLVEAYRKQYGHSWISAMPTNLYGPRDNFDLKTGHALPAMIHRFHKAKIQGAKSVEVWGDGTAMREFLHVDDLANACLLLLDRYDGKASINVGSGEEISIINLAHLIKRVVGYQGQIVLDKTKPNGTPRKLLESSKIKALGWSPRLSLEMGIEKTYKWFLSHMPISVT
jgi:GDP-L-fucose synthase